LESHQARNKARLAEEKMIKKSCLMLAYGLLLVDTIEGALPNPPIELLAYSLLFLAATFRVWKA